KIQTTRGALRVSFKMPHANENAKVRETVPEFGAEDARGSERERRQRGNADGGRMEFGDASQVIGHGTERQSPRGLAFSLEQLAEQHGNGFVGLITNRDAENISALRGRGAGARVRDAVSRRIRGGRSGASFGRRKGGDLLDDLAASVE